VEIVDPRSRTVRIQLDGPEGNVNGLAWSSDGSRVFAASGENGVIGSVRRWKVEDGKLEQTIRGHRDTIYALALSPDGTLLATGSYDQKIKLWRVADGVELRTLSGHNGAVFGVAFRPDGRLLASASADRTVKLWEVATGERRDTFSQPLKEQVGVAWSPDGKRLAAAGADHRIRIWNVSADARETTNPLAIARYAHEQPVLRVAWTSDGASVLSSAQDGTLKVWNAADMKERLALPKQPDWPTAIAKAGEVIVAGLGDGQLRFFNATTGEQLPARTSGTLQPRDGEDTETVAIDMEFHPACDDDDLADGIACQGPAAKEEKKAPAKAEIAKLSPSGVQRGAQAEVIVIGKNLPEVVSARCAEPKIAVFTGASTGDRIPLLVRIPPEIPRGSYEIAILAGDGKEIGRLPLRITDHSAREFPPADRGGAIGLPITFWGGLEKAGETDRYTFAARAGQTIVVDGTSKAIGGNADLVLELTDAKGAVLASSNNVNGQDAPFIAHRIAANGTYALLVKDLQMTGGPDHRYTVTVGELPWVVAAHPQTVGANRETEVELIGYNLPENPSARRVKVKAGAAGQVPVPIDTQRFYSRANLQLGVTDLPNVIEDRNAAKGGQPVAVPISINGQLARPGDRDLYRFPAQKGRIYAIETEAAKRGSPADTRIAVLWTVSLAPA
jgi:sugar lactone lactonase YvrE